ncbi:rhodanese-like domain-containing protein [Sediminibacterium sp.]|jgi:adenylyltransferase/sulfurtransferase|uniref:rhodanese-like domain-containing protein n=1 Tax=Sediminibacterium sp. TaxID=1917865 RepID=UPI0025F52F44|nr:rhodanese-like domain-containing protein [Sediminibacterium sp.]MBW0178668.1 rhodanese-like domain-containing protein [Sediminibacterium sp.]
MTHISPEDLKVLLEKEEVFLLDVREPDEHADYNIGGILIPLSEILLQYQQVPANRTVVVYCKKGIRSQIAIQRLQEKFGFSNLVNLRGGMDAWKKEDI